MNQAISIAFKAVTSALPRTRQKSSVARILIAVLALSFAGAASAAKETSGILDFGSSVSKYESAPEAKGMSLWVGKAKKLAVSAFTNKHEGKFASVGLIDNKAYSDNFRPSFESRDSRVFGIKLNYKF